MSEIKTYRKRPVEVQAMQYNGEEDLQALDEFVSSLTWAYDYDGSIVPLIYTLEGEMRVSEGDYIIKGIDGEFYPCKPDIFEKTYDEVKEDD